MFSYLHGFDPIVALIVFLLLLRFALPFIQHLVMILRYAFYPQLFQKLDGIPALAPVEQAAVAELEAQGFIPAIAFEYSEGPDRYRGVLLRHAELPAFARLDFRPHAYAGYRVQFFSFAKGGMAWFTTNRLAGFGSPPEVNLLDANAANLADHWQAHRERTTSMECEPLDAETGYARMTEVAARTFTWSGEQGFFVKSRSGEWFLNFPAAWRFTRKASRIVRAWRKPYVTPLTQEPYQSAYYAACFREQDVYMKRRRPRPVVGIMLLIISLLVSLAFWAMFNDWRMAAILVAIILFHESGHAVAMYAFGYRDMTMFFVPMLGAMVSGNIKSISVWKQAVILLAGPLPGLLAALYVMSHPAIANGHPYVYYAALIAFYVNLFNLLPVTPLDGGRLVEIALLSRWNYALFAFGATGFALAVALAIYFQSNAFVILLFLALYLRGLWRITRLRAGWKGTPGEDAELESLFDAARRLRGNLSLAKQYNAVKVVFTPRTIAKPRWWESLAVPVVMVGIWVFAMGVYNSSELLHAKQKTFDQDYAAYTDYEDGAPEGSAVLLNKLQEDTLRLPSDDPRQIDMRVLGVWQLPTDQARIQSMEEVLRDGQRGRFYSLRMIVGYYLSVVRASVVDAPPQVRIKALEAALAKAGEYAPGDYGDTVSTRLELAEDYDQAGQNAEAQRQLQELFQHTIPKGKEYPYDHYSVIQAQVWFYLSHNQSQQAIAFLESTPDAAEMKTDGGRFAFEYAWAMLTAGKHEEGLEQMLHANRPKAASPQCSTQDKSSSYPVDLAYAYNQAGKPEKAAELMTDPKSRHYCNKEAYIQGMNGEPWQGMHKTALEDTLKRFCASSAAQAE